MAIAAYTIPVHTSPETLWRCTRELADFPQRYDPRILAVRILEREDDRLVRSVRTSSGTRDEVVIVDDNGRTVTTLGSGESGMQGTMTYTAEAPPAGSGQPWPRLSGRLDWQSADGSSHPAEGAVLSQALQDQLHAIKHAAELRTAQMT